jgi:hypothetical protein
MPNRKLFKYGIISRQRGQALLWFLAMGAALAATFVAVYGVGQVTSEKQKIVNAADAAAYSGGMAQARILNVASYSNRAVIANEVFIAQMVSLDSWTSYVEKLTGNYENVLSVITPIVSAIPAVGQVLGPILQALQQLMRGLEQIASQIARAVDQATPAVITAWETAFPVWYGVTVRGSFTPPVASLAGMAAAQDSLRHNVVNWGGRSGDVAASVVNYAAFFGRNEYQWQNFTKIYRGNDRRFAKEVLLQSRDEFSTDRPGSRAPLLGTGKLSSCPPLGVGSEKVGITRMQDYTRWEAQDTLEFYTAAPVKCNRNYLPVGWGRATATRNAERGQQIQSPGRTAGQLAYSDSPHLNRGWTGVKELIDINRNNAGELTKNPAEVSFAIAVQKSGANIPTNERSQFAHQDTGSTTLGSPDVRANYANNRMASIAMARVFFERPPRRTQDFTGQQLMRGPESGSPKREYASLYNPYWQVRVKQPDAGEKAVLLGLAGANPAFALFGQ